LEKTKIVDQITGSSERKGRRNLDPPKGKKKRLTVTGNSPYKRQAPLSKGKKIDAPAQVTFGHQKKEREEGSFIFPERQGHERGV